MAQRITLSVAQRCQARTPERLTLLQRWAVETAARIGHNKAAAALANKLVRICWASSAGPPAFFLVIDLMRSPGVDQRSINAEMRVVGALGPKGRRLVQIFRFAQLLGSYKHWLVEV